MEQMNEQQDKDNLIKDIQSFIDKYAKISPNWDGTEDDYKYTGPDPDQFLAVISALKNNITPIYPWSEWSSGCYHPYTDKEGRQIHDSLIYRINTQYIKTI